MDANELLRWLVGLLALISLGAVAWSVTRSSDGCGAAPRALNVQPAETAPAAAPGADTETPPPASKARLPQPPTLPELIAEAADTPRDERLINAAASTMKTLSEGMQDAVWVAVVPRQFNPALLAALRPDWGALTGDVYERLQRLWFVSAVPDGSCVQSGMRRAMLRHLFRKDDQRENYLRHSLRAAKYFHARMVSALRCLQRAECAFCV